MLSQTIGSPSSARLRIMFDHPFCIFGCINSRYTVVSQCSGTMVRRCAGPATWRGETTIYKTDSGGSVCSVATAASSAPPRKSALADVCSTDVPHGVLGHLPPPVQHSRVVDDVGRAWHQLWGVHGGIGVEMQAQLCHSCCRVGLPLHLCLCCDANRPSRLSGSEGTDLKVVPRLQADNNKMPARTHWLPRAHQETQSRAGSTSSSTARPRRTPTLRPSPSRVKARRYSSTVGTNHRW